MITYTLKINSVKYHKVEGNLQNVIKSLSVTKVGVDSEGNASEFEYKLEFETPHESQFTPFEQITEDMMLSWIDSHPYGFNKKSEEYISAAVKQQVDSNEVETDKLPFA